MRRQTGLVAVGAVVLVATMSVVARGQAAPQQPPAGGQTPPAAPAGERGAGARQGGPGQAGGAQGGRGGGRRGGFTQYTRPLASQDVIVRGKSLYDANCSSCHAPDLRGTAAGIPNLLRSGMTLGDQKGELVGAAVGKHTPALTLVEADTTAIAEYIHSVQATMGGQGSPPGRNPTGVALNLLVGDAKAGEAAFGTLCSSCHSVTGDLKGIATKYSDPRALQNGWVSGSASAFGGGGRGGGGGGNPVTVTMADGSTLKGTLVRSNDFLVILNLPDGTRKSIARNNGVPKVEVTDPQAAHKKMVLQLDDAENKKMHDITAYLATIK